MCPHIYGGKKGKEKAGQQITILTRMHASPNNSRTPTVKGEYVYGTISLAIQDSVKQLKDQTFSVSAKLQLVGNYGCGPVCSTITDFSGTH